MSETPSSAVAVVEKIDNGKPALYNPAAFDQIWRASKLFSSSDLVPAAYRGKPENCFIAIEMADRMGISPFAMLQSLVIIQGKPSMEAKLIIALVNDSGLFTDPLDFEVVGDDPHAKSFKVRAFATMKKTGKVCHGPWITYQMVEGEGWLSKQGSKWKTIPYLMFCYRAASYFAKLYAPNITMGMNTREELEDIPSQPIDVTPPKPAPPLAALEPSEPSAAPAIVEPIVEDAEIVPEPEKKPAQRRKPQPAVVEEPPHPVEEPEPAEEPEPEEEMTPMTADEPTTEEEMGDLF